MEAPQGASREVAEATSDEATMGMVVQGTDPEPARAAEAEARPRLSWNRLDLAIKLHYLESAFGLSSAFSDEIYDEHLGAMAAATGEPGIAWQAEPGQSRAAFEETCRTLLSKGSDSRSLRVTTASDGTVLAGAHQAACALFLGRPVRAISTDLPPAHYDYRFFRRHGLGDDHLDAAVIRFVERAPDAYVALVWPAAQGADEEVERILGPLVYRKEVSLDPNGAHNLLTQVYAGEPWLGAPERNYPGVQNKLAPCFGRNGPLRVFVFQRPSLEETLAAKEAIRGLFGIGKHAIHITDTHAEAVKVARLLLNERGVHFLNVAHPTRYSSAFAMAAEFEIFLRRRGISPDKVAVDSGMVLAAYGLREAQDVDFVAPDGFEGEGLFSPHGPGAHQLSVGDLLHDPRHHFHYWGLKFVSLDQVARMKHRRQAGRDLDDLGLIRPALAAGGGNSRLRTAMNHLRYASAKGRRGIVQATRRLGIHGPLKAMRRRLRRRPR